MKPTIGDTVNYTQADRVPDQAGGNIPLLHYRAIVEEVHDDTHVKLRVFSGHDPIPGYHPSPKDVQSVPQDETATQPYTWHWPRRE